MKSEMSFIRENILKMSEKLCDEKDCPNYFYEDETEETIEEKVETEAQPNQFQYFTGPTSGPNGYYISSITGSPVYMMSNVVCDQSAWTVNKNPIEIKSDGKTKISLPCFDELGVNGIPLECLMCSNLKKIDMMETLIVHQAKKELMK